MLRVTPWARITFHSRVQPIAAISESHGGCGYWRPEISLAQITIPIAANRSYSTRWIGQACTELMTAPYPFANARLHFFIFGLDSADIPHLKGERVVALGAHSPLRLSAVEDELMSQMHLR